MRRVASLALQGLGTLVLLPLLLLVGTSAGSARLNAPPQAVVTVRGAIYAFAQDGDAMGWIAADARVRVRRVSTQDLDRRQGRPARAGNRGCDRSGGHACALGLVAGTSRGVPARSPTPEGDWVPRVGEDGPVEAFDLTGKLLMRVQLAGIVRDVALTGYKAAVLLERPDGSKLILRFDARNGTYLGGSGLLPLGATDLATGTGGIVFRDGRQVYVLRGRTARVIARAAGAPIGLSIEGRRIAWAENHKGRGHIVALTLPG